MKVTVRVDPDLCIGSATCVHYAPWFLELNEEDKAVVLDPHGGGGKYERVLDMTDAEQELIVLAAQSCPTNAISVIDEAGNSLAGGFAL